MMNPRWTCSMLIGAALLIGCDSKEEKKEVPTVPPSSPMSPMTPKADQTAAPDAAIPKGAGAQAAVNLDKVADYIKSNKLDLADKTLTQIEANKDALSPDLQKRVDQLRAALNAAKAAAGTGTTAIPAMPR